MAASTVAKLILELESRGFKGGAGEAEQVARALVSVEKAGSRSANVLAMVTTREDDLTKAIVKRDRFAKAAAAEQAKGIELTEAQIRTLAKLEAAVVGAQQKLSGNANDNSIIDGMSMSGAKYRDMANLMGQSSSKIEDQAKAVGLARHEWINLSRQIQDVGVSLYGGQSPFTVLAQQGGQIADVFSSSKGGAAAALKEFASTVSGYAFNRITLLGGAFAAATAAVVKFEIEQDRLELSLNGVGRAAGVTAEGLRQIAIEGAKAGNMTPGQGVDAAAALAGTGKIGGDLIQKLVPATKQFGRAFGLDEKTALEELGKAFADPAKGAETLNNRFGDLSIATRRNIEDLSAQGKTVDAQNLLFASLSKSIKNTTDTTWALVDAFEKLKSGFMNPVQTVGSFFDSLASSKISAAQQAAAQRKAAEDAAIKAANDLASAARPVVEKELPLLVTRQTLQNNVELLRGLQDNERAMKALGLSTGDVSRALEQYSTRLANLVDEATQTRQETESRTKAAIEQNVATRAGIEAEQEYKSILAKTGDAQLAAAKADAIRADSMASITVAMRDFNKEAANQLELAGKSPFQQQIIRLDQEAQALQDQYGSVPASMDAKYMAADRQYKADKITNPIADAEARMRVLEAQNKTLGMSTEAAAREIAAQEKRNELLKDQIEMTPTVTGYIDQYAEAQGRLAAATEAASRNQQQFKQNLDVIRSSAVDVGTTLADAFRKGENAGQSMLKVLDRLVSKLTETMMTRGIETLIGGTGTSNTGLLGSLMSGGAKSGGGVFGSVLSGVGKIFGFADGGIMTPAGSMPLKRYASGGIASDPQLAMFGEGARNEAYVPLPDGRRIPVAMQGDGKAAPKVTINNYAGAQVEARQMSDGEIMITVQNMINSGLKRVPGIMAESQRRAI